MPTRITPYVLYRDAAAALEWLGRALGFTEELRFTTDDGRVSHAEMTLENGARIMIGEPGPAYRNPADQGGATVLLHVDVDDDVDGRFARALEAGATVVREPSDQEYGARNCAVADPEGHHWWLSQPL